MGTHCGAFMSIRYLSFYREINKKKSVNYMYCKIPSLIGLLLLVPVIRSQSDNLYQSNSIGISNFAVSFFTSIFSNVSGPDQEGI